MRTRDLVRILTINQGEPHKVILKTGVLYEGPVELTHENTLKLSGFKVHLVFRADEISTCESIADKFETYTY